MILLGFCPPTLAQTTPKKNLKTVAPKAAPTPEEEEPVIEMPSTVPGESSVFYNARTTSLSKDLSRYIFEGDVVAIGGGTIVTADLIEADNKAQRMRASGHVVILTPRQVFLGNEMVYHWVTGDFKITDAIMVANDPKEVERVSRKVLGFTPEEIEFEAKRADRLDSLEAKKQRLRDSFRQDKRDTGLSNDAIVEDYALTLEQEELTRLQVNPALQKMPKSRRRNFEMRRRYWQASLKEFDQAVSGQQIYFRISGGTLERTNGNDYRALDASWTPCKCDEDESPAWGFHASRIDAQVEGYVDLVHPVLEIKGIPVLYLPFLKLPIKSQRQSGFLVPTFRTGDKKTGNVYTQPVYFALAPNADATVTTDIFQERGTRLGAELRYEQREFSGWTLNVESMRDRTWLDERNDRRYLFDYHQNNPDGALPKGEVNEVQLKRYLGAPSNTWRGKQEWRGQTFLASRLSLVSAGTLVSDHRYVGDLSLGDTFEELLNPGLRANAYSTAKTRVHLDGKDFYLGLGSSFGDSSLMETGSFKGLQMPWHVSFQTRMFSLLPGDYLPWPIYGNFVYQHIPIADFSEATAFDKPFIGSGEWRRSAVNLVAPIVREGVVRIDTFADLENRSIHHTGLAEPNSWIQSYRTGLTLNLPIDGQGELPTIFQPKDWQDQDKGARYLHHIMNWQLTFSARPVVVRRGPYGDYLPGTDLPQVYFASDRKIHDPNDQAATVEESMLLHRRITLATTHRWRTFRRGWQLIEGKGAEGESEKKRVQETYRQKAWRELEYSLDRPVQSDSDMFSERANNLNWFINRYQLTEHDAQEPVNFDSSITYDFVQEEERRKAILRNQEQTSAAELETTPEGKQAILNQVVAYPDLPRPWTGPYFNTAINWAGFTLSNQVEYDIYLRASRKMTFGLGLPQFWKMVFGGGYQVEKKAEVDKNTNTLRFAPTKTQFLTLTSYLIPRVTTTVSLAKKTIEAAPGAAPIPEQYETKFGFEYFDDSDCWGLRFLRSKNFDVRDERQATYLLQLTILFMGQTRAQDISPVITKQVNRDDAA